MTTAEVSCRQHGNVLELGLDRPRRRNALSRRLLHELRRALESLPSDTRAVVLTGTGPVFSAGADFADLTGTSADLDYDRDLEAACTALRTCAVPVTAAVDGPCLGAAVELVTSCDARVAGPRAWFRVPAVELGLLYNPSSIRRLHATLPRATTTRLLVLAERFDAAEAAGSGLATHYTHDDARRFALDLARTQATLPAEALAATRALLRDLDEGTYSAGEWEAVRIRLMDSEDRHEAVTTSAFRHGSDTP